MPPALQMAGVQVALPRLSVVEDSTYQVEITPDPMSVPTSGGGYPIGHVANARYSFVVPAGTLFVEASLSGGSNLGTGTPSVAQSGARSP